MKQSSLLSFFKSAVKDQSQQSQQDQQQQPSEQKEQQIQLKQLNEQEVLMELFEDQQNQYQQQEQQTTGRKKRLIKLIDSESEGEQNNNQQIQFDIAQFSHKKSENKVQSIGDNYKKQQPMNNRKVKSEITERHNGNILQEKKEGEVVQQEFDDSTPQWARLGYSRDKQRNLHGKENGDPTTLYIPPQDFKELTGAMQQYWSIKSDNFEKIIFFKLGKFYELFYEDALVGHKELDLNWMGRKMHTGFPEKALSKFSQILVERGYKVAVVEQTETPDQMQKRITENKKSGQGPTAKTVTRELAQVMTKGTIQKDDQGDVTCIQDERILMCIKKEIVSFDQEEYGVIIFESQTNKISLAQINNHDKTYQTLKTLLLQCKPLEVVIDPNNIRAQDPILQILGSQVIQTQVSHLRKKNDNWDGRKALHLFNDNIPSSVLHFQQKAVVLDALQGLFSYLDTILIKQKVVESARYQIYDPEKAKQNYMILDSQSLFNLEIFNTGNFGNNQQDYSLFGCIDRTVTIGGKRLLKRWICAPLYNLDKITERQDAIEDLIKYKLQRDQFRKNIQSLPDLERLCARIYLYSVKTHSKAVFYEDISSVRLKEFKKLCDAFRQLDSQVQIFTSLGQNFKSKRLRRLVQKVQILSQNDEGHIYEYDDNDNNDEEGLLPNIINHLDDFESYIQWKNDVPLPVQGILDDYDDAESQVQEKKQQMNQYLELIRKRFNDKTITYAHAKYRYELELQISLVQKSKPDDFEFTSQRQGFQRFHTMKIKDMIFDLEQAEDNHKRQLSLFLQHIFKHFHQNYRVWDRFISIINELDALCSLSTWSEHSDGIMCRPKFVVGKRYLQIVEGRHPCLIMAGVNFIPNTVNIGDQFNLLLLTGPNMGGKSTTLRMICILVILAQLGAYVPAQYMELSLIDRIFTRIGAKDLLIEGKSTFYIELEETLTALNNATQHSLFITDELGRGTSTYDGVAIAYSVMKYMVLNINCLIFFSTHFQTLVEEAYKIKGIINYHMACFIEEKNEKVVFLYKLKPGPCPASFGINVARVTGIPSSVIERAKEKAIHFEKNVGLEVNTDLIQKFYDIINH